MSNWYVKRDNETVGPLTKDRLKELAAQGKVQGMDMIREGEIEPFIPANQIPGLFISENPVTGLTLENDSENGNETQQSSSTPTKRRNSSLVRLILIGVPFLVLLAFGTIYVSMEIKLNRYVISRNNLRQMGLALHNYHATHRVLPPGGTLTHDEKPYLSWQTMILPYIDQARVYNKLHHSYPWTHSRNRSIFKSKIPLYLNPAIDETVSADGFGLSHYVGNQNVMFANSNLRFRYFNDGLPNTILAIETGENFKPWGDPTNFADPVNLIGAGKKSSFKGGNNVLMSDGAVRFVSENIDPAVLKALSTPYGGEVIDDF